MLLARYGLFDALKRVGSQLVGCCPLHRGTNNKQFVVGLASQSWHCFGDCNRGGGVIDFVALRENASIPAAAKLIADWFAIPTRDLSQQPNERTTDMTTTKAQPSHYLWIVEERADNPDKPTWHRVAAAWPQRDGKGLTIQLPPGVSVSGRLILRENDERKARGGE
jgi:CHC2-type zinc finger protein